MPKQEKHSPYIEDEIDWGMIIQDPDTAQRMLELYKQLIKAAPHADNEKYIPALRESKTYPGSKELYLRLIQFYPLDTLRRLLEK